VETRGKELALKDKNGRKRIGVHGILKKPRYQIRKWTCRARRVPVRLGRQVMCPIMHPIKLGIFSRVLLFAPAKET